MEPAYWRNRLFTNTFTYKGKTRRVNGWCVRIQLFGKRKTFSLSSSEREQAAAEASRIYQAINLRGWDAVPHRGGAGIGPMGEPARAQVSSTDDTEDWAKRLLHRRYPERKDPGMPPELSARIEHGGNYRYFPMGTDDAGAAAREAKRIHQTIVEQGWAVANQKFVRELTLAFRWLDNPLAWTYTTVHTWNEHKSTSRLPESARKSGSQNVAILEPDTGLRLALIASVNSQPGFTCRSAYASSSEACREVTRQRVDFVLLNYSLPNQPGAACLEDLRRARPGLLGLLYSVFEDSDQLFKSTPGGAAGYLLKRTPWFRIFEPLAETKGSLTQEIVAASIRDYFQRLVAAMPSGTSALELARLTPREHEILARIAQGYLAKEIADALGISIWTVHGHVKSIFEKLNVHTRTEAVVKFLQK